MDPAAADDPVLGGVPERFMALQWHDYACTPAAGMATLGQERRVPAGISDWASARGARSFTSRSPTS